MADRQELIKWHPLLYHTFVLSAQRSRLIPTKKLPFLRHFLLYPNCKNRYLSNLSLQSVLFIIRVAHIFFLENDTLTRLSKNLNPSSQNSEEPTTLYHSYSCWPDYQLLSSRLWRASPFKTTTIDRVTMYWVQCRRRNNFNLCFSWLDLKLLSIGQGHTHPFIKVTNKYPQLTPEKDKHLLLNRGS